MEKGPRPDVNSDITNLLWMLRSENSRQYYTLVKMHLSFTTDLSTDQCDGKLDNVKSNSGKWNLTPLKKKFKNNSNTSKCLMDGVPLTQEGVCHAYQLINFLSKDENIKLEGIFRKAGSFSRQLELKNDLNSGVSLNLECGIYSAHDCATVLKTFLAELPEPLLQEDHYHVHCRIAEMCSSEIQLNADSQSNKRRVKALQLVFLLLPIANYQLLKDLLLLLHKVAQFEDCNKMSANNLGTLFSPHILCPRKMTPNDMQTFSKILSTAVAFMIQNADKLFQIPFELEIDVRHYWISKNQNLTDETDGGMTEAATAATSFTFIDKDLTAKANDNDVTKIALANLYAYVQSLPESARKRKLVKQFNQASGRGTPVKGRSEHKEPKMRMISDSIKRHLLHKSVKSYKNKSRELSNNTPSKRSSTSDVLNNSSCCSPELKIFRRMSPKRFSKSLENLSPSRSKSSPPYNVANPQSFITPIRKNSLFDTSKESVFTPELGLHGAVSLSDQSLNVTPKLAPCNKATQLFGSGEFSASENSPISRAVRQSNIQQKEIMTPRSRCPIIINSSTSLASVYMSDLEKEGKELLKGGKENCQNVVNDLSNDSEKTKCDNKISADITSSSSGLSNYNSACSTWSTSLSSNSSIDYKSMSSGSSLFGGFYDKLSTSSLMKLTSKLSGSSLRPIGMLSPCIESVRCEDFEQEQKDDSLSSVFKDYLINRSIPINEPENMSPLSNMENNSSGNFNQYLSPTQSTSLSDSLLFCLDGNNPLNNSGTSNDVNSPNAEPTQLNKFQRKLEDHLNCSPNGRNKLFRNKHGTPVPKMEHDISISRSNPKTFETSF